MGIAKARGPLVAAASGSKIYRVNSFMADNPWSSRKPQSGSDQVRTETLVQIERFTKPIVSPFRIPREMFAERHRQLADRLIVVGSPASRGRAETIRRPKTRPDVPE